ncbi:MAG TPA: response regulator [Thermoanaerobaculia bacterium]|nr:response regulator [Thermoanaerobaculia bacterium]
MKRRILLADDSVTIQKVIELTFMDEDFEVRAVSNGDEAVALLSEVKPDFVIADVHMPGANGYEVCRRSKQLRLGVPVLLLVGTFEPFDENEARAAGADSFLKKPFDSQELLQRVQELLATAAPPAAQAAPASPSTPTLEFPLPARMPPPPPSLMPEPLPPPPPPVFAPEPEPAWGSFDLGPTPAEPFPPPAPAAAPEPYDREPSFSLEPDPAYQVEQEPVFELEEESVSSFAVREDVFGAPDELAFDEPHDRYVPEEPAPPAAAAAPVAGFDWSAAPTSPEPLYGAAAAPEPQLDEPFPAWQVEPEPEPQEWAVPAPPEEVPAPPAPQAAWSMPEPLSAPPLPPPAPAAAPAAAVSGNGHLSDADVDRIARRVVELMGDKTVRDVAWEVIPDMAEVIIRDRLRELESQVE